MNTFFFWGMDYELKVILFMGFLAFLSSAAVYYVDKLRR